MNPIDYFLRYIDAIQTLTFEEKTQLQVHCKVYTYEPHTYLLRAGDVSNTMYFVCSGLVRSYYNDKITGESITSWLIKEGGFIYSVNSYVNVSISFENIIAEEKTSVVGIHKHDLYALMSISGIYAKIALKLTEHYLQIYDERVRSLQYSAEERYRRFESQFPDLLLRVKKDHIASYLGMCKASFRKIRAMKH